MMLHAPWGLTLIVFLFSVYGLVNAIAVLKIGQFFLGTSHCTDKNCTEDGHPRETRKGLGRIPYLGDLFYCPPCLAFWVGMACSKMVLSPAAILVEGPWKPLLLDGLLASGVIWLLHLTAERLMANLDI